MYIISLGDENVTLTFNVKGQGQGVCEQCITYQANKSRTLCSYLRASPKHCPPCLTYRTDLCTFRSRLRYGQRQG